MHAALAQLVETIQPHDPLEQEHIAATLAWIRAGAPLWRMTKPDVPPQHLVSYFVLLDADRQQVLLVDHKNARLWLPPGGHVEPHEHPATTVIRELREELGISAPFLFAGPLFVTVTRTVGVDAGHTDVSLWYVLRGDSAQPLTYDPAEFHAIQWFTFATIPDARTDPHLQRFIAKLRARLADLPTL